MSADSKKELYIVGLGPGARQKMTQEAIDVVEACEVIAGYKVYIDLLKPYYPDKEYLVNGMRQEVERCRLALETAAGGKKTALVCSGDAGVYGMAGITLELATEFPEVDVHVIPGVTAALSGAALLGAPLGHDFTVISLSDLLTPWELIERRLAAPLRVISQSVCTIRPVTNDMIICRKRVRFCYRKNLEIQSVESRGISGAMAKKNEF